MPKPAESVWMSHMIYWLTAPVCQWDEYLFIIKHPWIRDSMGLGYAEVVLLSSQEGKSPRNWLLGGKGWTGIPEATKELSHPRLTGQSPKNLSCWRLMWWPLMPHSYLQHQWCQSHARVHRENLSLCPCLHLSPCPCLSLCLRLWPCYMLKLETVHLDPNF